MNQKQTAFLNAYLETRNASEAARRAGYSEKTCATIGHELLRKPEIAGAIEAATATARTAAVMSLTEALETLSDIARNDKMTFARIRALELLTRLQKWETEHSGDVKITVHYGDRGAAGSEI